MANIQAGDFCLVLQTRKNWGREFVISLISWGTSSPAYHAALVVDHPTLGLRLVEAEPGGAILSPLDAHSNAVWAHLDITDEQRVAVSEAGLTFVGRKYNWYDDALLGFSRVFKFKGPKWLWALLSNGYSVECAQLVDAAELIGGVHLFDDGRQTGEVAPADLYKIWLNGSKIPYRQE